MPPDSSPLPVPAKSFPKWLAANAALAVGYAFLGYLVLVLAPLNAPFSGFWFSAGLGIATLYLFGRDLWPGVFFGACALNYYFHPVLPPVILVAAGSALEAWVGAWFLQKSPRFSSRIAKMNDVFVVVCASVLACATSALVGTSTVFMEGSVKTDGVLSAFATWWGGNILGTLVVAPAILAWTNSGSPSLSRLRKLECAMVVLVGCVLSWFIFCLPETDLLFLPMPFLVFFFITWIALRFTQRVATFFVLLVALAAIWGTVRGLGAFAGDLFPLWDGHQRAQAFIIVCSIVSMLVSATTTNLYERSQRLENSERRYRQLFDSGPDPLWIYSPQQERILAVNECAISRLGYSREEFLKLRPTALLSDETSLPTNFFQPGNSAKMETLLCALRARDGSQLQVRLTARVADFFGETTVHILAQDVSDQVRAEDDLRKSEQKLHMHIHQTALGVIEWNQDFEVVEWNPAAERIFGYRRDDAIGREAHFLVTENYQSTLATIWERITSSTVPVRSINENVTRAGDIILCEWFNTPLADKDGQIIGAASLVQDVTLRESIKQSVRESEEKFRSVIESSPMGIQIYEMRENDDLILIGANPAAQNFMGFTNEEVLGKTIEEAFPAMAGTNIPEMYRLAAKEGKASWTDQVIYDSGELRAAYEVNAFQTVPGKMVAMFLDVTERRRTEQALRLRDKAMEAISQGIVIMTRHPDGSFPIIYANPAFEKITHYTHDQILGQSWRVLTGIESETSDVQMIEQAFANEIPVSVEMRSYRQDGTAFQSAVSISPIVDVDGRTSHYVGVYTDVTSIKKLETQFRQSQKMEAIGRLAGGVAHDFNNLLTAIIGYNDINLSMLERDTMLSRNSGEIQKAAERAASLTGQMLAFSRQQNLQPTRVALNKAISSMYQMLARLIGETIEIRTLLDDSLADIKAGASQIEQVILNLAINARDAMPDGGVLSIRTANVTVGRELSADIPGISMGEYVLLSLNDTGTGMDEHTKEHLFEPFFTTKEKGKGTGLGLATCYGIITQSSGFVAVHTKLGRGTTFDVYFPTMGPAGPAETNRVVEMKVQGGHETLLIVEDDPAVRPLTTNILRSLGYTVLEAGNGVEAQECLRLRHGAKIDLLLTDVVMPKMGGKELADWMKISHPGTKILFASGYLENILSREDIGDDEAFFLRKPFTARTLARKVRSVLDCEEAPLLS